LRFSNLSGSLSRSGKTNFINFQTQIPNSYEKSAQNITLAYYAVYVAAILSAISGYYLLRSGFSIDPQSQTGITVSTILILLIIGSIPVTLGLFHRFTKKWVLLEDRNLRIKKYQTASFIRLTIIGVGLVLGMIFFYIMNSQSMLFCAGIAAIALFFCKPSEVKMVSELNLDELAD